MKEKNPSSKRQQKLARRAAEAVELRKLPYEDYLKSAYWQQRRFFALRRAGFRCQVCNTDKKKLNVHHRSYERIGEEKYADIIVLCEDCHKLFHQHYKIEK